MPASTQESLADWSSPLAAAFAFQIVTGAWGDSKPPERREHRTFGRLDHQPDAFSIYGSRGGGTRDGVYLT